MPPNLQQQLATLTIARGTARYQHTNYRNIGFSQHKGYHFGGGHYKQAYHLLASILACPYSGKLLNMIVNMLLLHGEDMTR